MFFCSPIKLVKLIMSSSSTAEQIHEYEVKENSAWYMGEEGKALYQKATTLNAKMQFFRSYLNTIKSKQTGHKIVDLTAFVITCGIEGTSLPFAAFPDIIDPMKNPIVKKFVEKDHPDDKCEDCGLEMLNALMGSSHPNLADWYDPQKRAYKRLEICSNNHSQSDMYKLQRYIIGAFCYSDGKFKTPYVYDIVSSSNLEGDNE